MKEDLIRVPSINGQRIHYFDYAATSFMPQRVIDKWVDINTSCGVSIGRGSSFIHKMASDLLEKSESVFMDFWGFEKNYEFVYAKNVTEAINIMALGLKQLIKPMDIIVVGPYEHHSNYLPWKRLAEQTGALFFEIPIGNDGNLEYDFLEKYCDRIKVLSVSSISNSFGYVLEIDKIINCLKENTYVFVDESQKVANDRIYIDSRISGHFLPSHKMYGPKGIAGIALRKDLLNVMSPVFLGGGMVEYVGYKSEWNTGRTKFLAGTVDVSLIGAWAESCEFIKSIGYDRIIRNNNDSKAKIIEKLKDSNMILVGDERKCCNHIISFYSEEIHAHDVNEIMGKQGIVIRSGHLCSQNAMRKMQVNAINRISLGLGVCQNDIETLFSTMEEIKNGEVLFR